MIVIMIMGIVLGVVGVFTFSVIVSVRVSMRIATTKEEDCEYINA